MDFPIKNGDFPCSYVSLPEGIYTFFGVITNNWRFLIHSITGWWYTYPSEKWWSSSVGIMTFDSHKIPWFHYWLLYPIISHYIPLKTPLYPIKKPCSKPPTRHNCYINHQFPMVFPLFFHGFSKAWFQSSRIPLNPKNPKSQVTWNPKGQNPCITLYLSIYIYICLSIIYIYAYLFIYLSIYIYSVFFGTSSKLSTLTLSLNHGSQVDYIPCLPWQRVLVQPQTYDFGVLLFGWRGEFHDYSPKIYPRVI